MRSKIHTCQPQTLSNVVQSERGNQRDGLWLARMDPQAAQAQKGVQCNVTYAILHNYAKRDSRLTAYGGIVLQRFEFVKVCMGRQRLCWKSQLFLYFVDKIYLPCCRVVFFVVCQLRRPI